MRTLKYLNFFIILTLIITGSASLYAGADKPAYNIFSRKGTPVNYVDMLNRAAKADVILFGEHHHIPLVHWLQLELAKDLLKVQKSLIIGAEMFERDDQLIIDEYLQGFYSRGRFEGEVKLWPNYRSDYRPLIDLAKENRLKFLATNIPRRYASMVFKDGFSALQKVDQRGEKFLPPLPVKYDPKLKCYSDMALRLKGKGHNSPYLPKAQALKDATMAHVILNNVKTGTPLLHINGAWHSDNFEGIYWHLAQSKKRLFILTITTSVQEDISSLQKSAAGKADFIILIPASMTPSGKRN